MAVPYYNENQGSIYLMQRGRGTNQSTTVGGITVLNTQPDVEIDANQALRGRCCGAAEIGASLYVVGGKVVIGQELVEKFIG